MSMTVLLLKNNCKQGVNSLSEGTSTGLVLNKVITASRHGVAIGFPSELIIRLGRLSYVKVTACYIILNDFFMKIDKRLSADYHLSISR